MMRLGKASPAFVVLALLAANSALAKGSEKLRSTTAKAEISSQGPGTGFDRPETITGTILVVKAEEGLVVLAVRGPSQPPSTNIVVHTKTVHAADAVIREEETTVSEGPGETDLNFRVAGSTLIKVDGRPVALSELASLKGWEATVRFVPRRAGNFALGIEVG